MITVLFDNQIFKKQKFGGISRYFSKLIQLLRFSENYCVLPKRFFADNRHLDREEKSKWNILYGAAAFRGRARIIRFVSSVKERRFKEFIRGGKYDIFHPTYYDGHFLKDLPATKPFILTVHDMIHELYYDRPGKVHEETRQKALLIPKAAHIIAVSEHTKKDICFLYPDIDPNLISVIYHGYNRAGNIDASERLIQPEYILFVGGRWDYKNFKWTIESIASFLKQNDLTLVCAGGGVFTEEEKKYIFDAGIEDHVQFCDIANDNLLDELYRHAFCFLFPSLYEGFGIPILEAFANDCPVVLSNATCFPEIAKEAALYFEINDAKNLTDRLNSLFEEEKRQGLVAAGRERLKNFSWEKTAGEHKKVYESVIHGYSK